MRTIIKKIAHPFLRVFASYYFSKPRKYNYKHLKGIVNTGVFHPQFTISTKLLLDFIDLQNLKDQQLLELGCGTGLISTYAAMKGAKVMATDINPFAIENAKLNAENNKVEIITIHSNLFQNIPQQVFDYIIINPPYYPKAPKNEIEQAWYCGENFEYFQHLFKTIHSYFDAHSKVVMILSEDCDLEHIQQLAESHQMVFELLEKKRKWGEENYLFQLKSI